VKHLIFAAAVFCLAGTTAQAAGTIENPFGATAVSEQTMSQQRGGTEVSQSAVATGDCDKCTVNGTSTVSGSAFTHASGLFTVIQNTGANVILQNSTVVNINIH
jgi:hypothetical protein